MHSPTFGFGALGSVSSDDESSEVFASKHTPSIDAIPEGDPPLLPLYIYTLCIL